MLLQVNNGTKDFRGEVLFEDINFEIKEGRKIAVIGRNGCGKTTLINLPERFKVYPTSYLNKKDAEDWVFYFWDTNSLGFTEGIYQIDAHIVRNADGTLDMGSRASVCFIAKERERWEELYTAYCEALMEMLGRDSLMTTVSGDYESSLYMTHFVTKDIDGDGNFTIYVEMPLRDPVEEQSEA